MDGYNKHHLSDYGDQIISDSLGAHSLLISTCVRELRSKSQIKKWLKRILINSRYWTFLDTKADLEQTTNEVESIKEELKGNFNKQNDEIITENLKEFLILIISEFSAFAEFYGQLWKFY